MTSLFQNLAAFPTIQRALAQVEYQTSSGGGGIIGAIFGLVWLAIVILSIVGLWKLFEKAGKPGWAAIVPIYNCIVMLEIVGKPIWWIVLFFIPFVNIVIIVMVLIALAKSFGKSAGYGIACIFVGFILLPMLGFSDAKYLGPQS